MQIELEKFKKKIRDQLIIGNEVKKIYVSKLFLQKVILQNIEKNINPFDNVKTIYGRPLQIDEDLKDGYLIGVE